MESNGGHFMAGRLSAGTTESRGLVPHFLRVPYGEKSMASTSYRILFCHTPKNTHGFIFADFFFDFCCCFPMEKWLESWLGPGVQFYRLQQTQCQHYGAGFVMTWRRAGADGASGWDQKKMALASSWWMKSVELKHWTIPHVTMISEWTVQVTSQLYRLCGGCGVVKN